MDLHSLLNGENASFIDEKYREWLSDPAGVEGEWASLFAQWERVPGNGTTPGALPSFARSSIFHGTRGDSEAHSVDQARKQARVAQLINAFRVWGHLAANVDPLGQWQSVRHPELTLGYWGLKDSDLDTQFPTAPLAGMTEWAPLRAILQRCQEAYSDVLGTEFMNIDDVDQKRWVQRRLEVLPTHDVLDRKEEMRVLRKLSDAENFERMIHQRFPGTKRFSLEGGETLIPLLDILVEHGSAHGVDEIVIGMAHRGRLNVLANIMQKPMDAILGEFEGMRTDLYQGSGDVKYHVGYSADAITSAGRSLHLSLTPNPSHLEAVNPVVEGRVRAKQDRRPMASRQSVMPVLVHGDAAFAGQGVVAETLQLSELEGYGTKGTVHIVVNNQIGFTTGSKESRSTTYATGMARMLGIPIFHVNGESPRAVAAAVKIAVEWRQTFQRDVVIDMFCYRKYGHNEGDEPSFTQPELYRLIRNRPTPRAVYAEYLVKRGYLSAGEVETIATRSREVMEAKVLPNTTPARIPVELSGLLSKGEDQDTASYFSKKTTGAPAERIDVKLESLGKGLWDGFSGDIRDEVDTGMDMARLTSLIRKANQLPESFRAHPKIQRILNARLAVANGERKVDWAVAEQAAYASLLTEGFGVRLSGQDCGRGTFSHRHAVLVAPESGERYLPLCHLAAKQEAFEVWNSSLSEAGVLGFEFGYSIDSPQTLVLWEAQFGDFVNGAQILIDQFIVSAEQKWNRLSGLVMLLPHGMESQGPEHSSGRLERFLQACAQDNIQVANCTTPANIFHLLRRQCLRRVRKPLIVMAPKSGLRLPAAVSTLEDLAHGKFMPVIPDPTPPKEVRRVVFCSGKVFFDVDRQRQAQAVEGVGLHRVELLYPFPGEAIGAILASAPEAEVVWCQEEPRNMGPWPRMFHWFVEHFPSRVPRYVGREEAASPAHGSSQIDRSQQVALVNEVLSFKS